MPLPVKVWWLLPPGKSHHVLSHFETLWLLLRIPVSSQSYGCPPAPPSQHWQKVPSAHQAFHL